MFNLIVTILALVLMIGAAIAGLTYLGPAFLNSQVKANVAGLLNGGLQIQGAQALYRSDNGGTSATGTQLTDGTDGQVYLTQLPVVPSSVATGGWALSTDGTSASVPLNGSKASIAVCAYVAAQAGPYSCDSATAPTVFTFKL